MRYNQYPPLAQAAMLDFLDGHCPYCGEPVSLAVDTSAGSQRYVEDCPVCCKPMSVVLDVDPDGGSRIHLLAQDDT